MPLLLLLMACDKPAPEVVDDTDPGPSCPAALALEVPAAAAPGEVVAVTLAGALGDGVAAWSASVGEVSGEGSAADWALPTSLATHQPEVVVVSVRVEAAGCEPWEDSAEVVVDHPEGARVVALWNPEVEGSLEVARAYAGLRELPEANLCAASSADTVTLPGEQLEAWLAGVMDCVEAAGPQVHVLLPVWGVPYKVSGRIDDFASGSPVTTSLDALLVFGRRGARMSQAVYNPLYQDGDSFAGAYAPWVPFGALREAAGQALYLVTRVDGADRDAALALVDRAALARQLADAGALDGVVYVDGRFGDAPPSHDDQGSYEYGEWNMHGTRAVFEQADLYPVVWDGNAAEFGAEPAPLTCPDALYYAGWYSFNHYNDAFTWADGAIGGHLDSCSACDLRGGPAWSANALQRGITATFGAVNEPYVIGMPEYDQLFLYLLQGASFAEAAYESTVVGAWMMTFVGDPLYRPYATPVL